MIILFLEIATFRYERKGREIIFRAQVMVQFSLTCLLVDSLSAREKLRSQSDQEGFDPQHFYHLGDLNF